MTNIKKILFVMLLCGIAIFCATEALAATTQTAIGNVSEEIKILAIEDGHWGLWPGIEGTTDSTVYDADDDNDEAPPPPGDDDDDDEPPAPTPEIPTPEIETPDSEEPDSEKREETSEEPKHVYDPLLDSKQTISNVLSSNAVNMYSIRTTSDSVSDRIDELVSADDSTNIDSGWASIGGSKTGKSGSFKDESTTYEVGYDQLIRETKNKKQYAGFSLTYNRGSIKYDGMNGKGKERDETIAIYTIDKYKHGQYLSFVGTAGRYSNSYDLWGPDDYTESAKNKTYGFSGSVVYGRKIHNEGWYIDPHLNATFAYLAGNDYDVSNGTHVESGGVPSLIGKAGINVGKYFGRNDCGVVYVKTALCREFLGDYKTTMYYYDTGSRVAVTGNVRENWFDYGIGISYMLSNRDYLSISVGKSTGGNCYKDWIWNLGFKFSF